MEEALDVESLFEEILLFERFFKEGSTMEWLLGESFLIMEWLLGESLVILGRDESTIFCVRCLCLKLPMCG